MAGAFTATERNALERALAMGEDPVCPACEAGLTQRAVRPSKQVSYVRRRVWLLCPSCKRTGAVDVREEPRGGGGPLSENDT